MEHPLSIVLEIALLTVFLCLVAGMQYAVPNNFSRTRLIMSAFFVFIVLTLSISFWQFAFATFPFTIPAALLGVIAGYYFGVRAAEYRLRAKGVEHYMEHFAHVHVEDLRSLTWWSFVNFYTIAGRLLLINLVGLSSVIFRGAENWAISTSVVGAFLLGTLVPYLLHLWSIQPPKNQERRPHEQY